MAALNGTDRTVVLRVHRQHTPDEPARWEEFAVPCRANTNVIGCLQYIAANPITTDGKTTTPPVWESVCLEEMCGACTMLINGKPMQACSALVGKLAEPGKPITLAPLTKFPVVRDLMVDRRRLFDDLKRIKAWVPLGRTDEPKGGLIIPPSLQQKRYILSRCISCGACLEACPRYTLTNNFFGAAIFSQAMLFNNHPVGAKLKSERLKVLMGPGGVGECDTSGNCTPACPKCIPNGDCIEAIGQQVIEYATSRMKPRPKRQPGRRPATTARRSRCSPEP